MRSLLERLIAGTIVRHIAVMLSGRELSKDNSAAVCVERIGLDADG
jgi:hypothetical protein